MPAPLPPSRGGPLGRPPPGPPPAINHPPFSSARGPDRREAGSGASEERRRSRAVWCWPTAKFLQWKSLGGALVPHTQTRDLSALQKAHYPQCELVRARALPVLNSADATSARSLRLRRLLGGRRLDPRAQAAVPLHRPAVFVNCAASPRPPSLGVHRLAAEHFAERADLYHPAKKGAHLAVRGTARPVSPPFPTTPRSHRWSYACALTRSVSGIAWARPDQGSRSATRRASWAH